jgi:hypothetical protein
MLPPLLLAAIDSLMKALALVFLFGLIAILYRMAVG